ncbi:MAG: phosphatase PAP2 family protein [Actinomycetaceae bacterium]|nr:phosphatase PAP2 family protein [Actinomycetaceae bacterium]
MSWREIKNSMAFKRIKRVGLSTFYAAIAAAITWVCVYTVPGQNLDALAHTASKAAKGALLRIDTYLLDLVSIPIVAGVMAIAAAVALIRKRWALAARAILLVVGANVTTQALKHYILQRPDLGVDIATVNSLPSGHTTAAAAAAAALIMVVPHSWRTAATWLGTILTTLMGASVLANGWHRLSDVLVAILVVATWTLALAPYEKRRRRAKRATAPKDSSTHSAGRAGANGAQTVLAALGLVSLAAGALALGSVILEVRNLTSWAIPMTPADLDAWILDGTGIGLAWGTWLLTFGLTALIMRMLDGLAS